MWSDTAKNPKLFFVDARISAIFMLFFMHMALWTFIVSFFLSFFLSILPFFGVDLKNAWRQIITWVAGKSMYSGDPEWMYLRRMQTQYLVRKK